MLLEFPIIYTTSSHMYLINTANENIEDNPSLIKLSEPTLEQQLKKVIKHLEEVGIYMMLWELNFRFIKYKKNENVQQIFRCMEFI